MSIFAPTLQNLEKAAALLKKGDVVAFPTETVYGLGADAFQEEACQKIFAIKGRPSFNPLIVHCKDLDQVASFALLNAPAKKLAERFWPGPLTLVLKKKSSSRISSLVTAGLETVAVRIPFHPVAQDLLNLVDFPIAAPSANSSGFLSPTKASHVFRDLGRHLEMILDASGTQVGVESTIVDVSEDEPILLRVGGLDVESIEECLQEALRPACPSSPMKSPGLLLRHYASRYPLRLNAQKVYQNEGLLAFGEELKGARLCLNLSREKNLKEAARNLFSMLHILDECTDIERIAVQPIPEEGLGRAINDRLRRGAEKF